MITVNGTGFISSTVIEVGGVSDATTYVSSTQVTALLPSSQLAAAGTSTIVASNGNNIVSSESTVLQIDNPVPAISQISPATLTAGAAAGMITITGTGFVAATIVQVDGSSRQTTFVSGTQLMAVLTATDLAGAGMHSITAVNAAPGGGTSSSATLFVNNPVPTLTALSPASIAAGTATPTTITVTGTNFVDGATVQVNGSARATAVVNATQLTFQLTVADQSVGASLSVAVVNPTPGGGASATTLLSITNPIPTITQVSPAVLTAGSAAITVTVTGTNFVSATAIQVGGSSRPATFASATQVNFQLTAADLTSSGSLSITAVNPAPGGGSSAAATIAINNPMPSIFSLNPYAAVSAASSPTTITVTGTNFLPVSVVQVGGSQRTTTYVSSTQLTFQLTVADQANTADLSVTVVNPAPGGGTSSMATLIVAAATATPMLSSVTPNQIVINSPATTISVFGTGITRLSVVQWNGASLSTYYGSCPVSYNYVPCLNATVPANLLMAVGTASITVYTPTSTPSISNALQVAVTYSPVPTLTSLSATLGPINTAVSITLTGQGFVANSSAMLNGAAVPTTFISSTSLRADLAAASLATPGVFPVTVTTPAPGGGTSTAQYFTAYVGIPNNSMVYNSANGMFYLSVPSAAAAPYGNAIVPIDPLTGSTGAPIPVGSEPNRLAITSDGKYLWVALDGAAAVRQVDLTTGTAGLQFPIGPSGSSVNTVAALAALPGSPNSVVVSTYYGGYTTPTGVSLSIYDSGVPRPNSITFSTYAPFPWALLVNGSTSEIYGPGSVLGSGYPEPYITYSYDANGITQKSSTNSTLVYAESNQDDIQIIGSTLYTSYGQGVDAETGALLGTFYSSGTNVAQGSFTIDTALDKAFILDGSSSASGGTGSEFAGATLEAFNTADYSATSATPINVGIPLFRASYQYEGSTGSRLTRWGSNGLAFRSTGGFVSLRSNLVNDLSSVDADVAVSLTVPSSASTGTTVAFTATVTNNGPSSASSIGLSASAPSNGVLISATPSTGTCSAGNATCDLGTLANGASATVIFSVLQTSSGSATMTVHASASETDLVASNNQATATVAITGGAYSVSPVLSAVSPAAIVTGSSDTSITVTGTGFSSGSTVLLNGNPLVTTYTSATMLAATVPAANLTSLGWASISVSTPAPGGGTSSALALSVFSVLELGANHILYDPYLGNVMASVGTGTSTVAANSIVSIVPSASSFGTPVPIGGTPTNIALTDDGNILYALLPSDTNASVARFNMLTHQPDFTVSGFQVTGYGVGLSDIATQPGTENTIAVNLGQYVGDSLYDFDPASKTGAMRGTATGLYNSGCPTFPSQSILFIGGGQVINPYTVTSTGLTPVPAGSELENFNCFKLNGGFAYAGAGGVASINQSSAVQTGVFEGIPNISNYGAPIYNFEPDSSLGSAFYLTDAYPNQYSSIFDSITAFNIHTFLPGTVLPLPIASIEGNTDFTGVDIVRWGQDGLAILTSGGNVYLIRGPLVVPGLLGTSTAATLASSSSMTLMHGSGNTLLTLSGTNFLPGVAVTWNGSYRTTTVVSPTQITIAIPASDVAVTGMATLVATNPGAPASAAVTITVQ